MLKAILFDLGDTLFDFRKMDRRLVFEQAGRQTYAFLQSRGCTLPPYKKYFRTKNLAVWTSYFWSVLRRREFNCFDTLCRVCRKMKIDVDDATLRDLAWQWYSPIPQYTSVADDVIPTLTKLSNRYKLAIVSNTFIPGFVLDRHLEHHKLLEFFPTRIYSSDVGVPKPHPRIFHAAFDALDITPAEGIFVGDRVKTDIVGARRVGMRTVLRQPAATSLNHHLADFVIRRICDLRHVLPQVGAIAPLDLPDGEVAYDA